MEEGGTHPSCRAGRRGRTGSQGDRSSGREPRGRPRPARRAHPDAPPPAPGESACPLGWELLSGRRGAGPRPEHIPRPHRQQNAAAPGLPAGTGCLPSSVLGVGVAPSLKRRCFLKGPEVKQKAPAFLGGDFAHLEKQALLGG